MTWSYSGGQKKVTAGRRDGEGIHVNTGALKAIF